MPLYRKTYAQINLRNIQNNVKNIIQQYGNYTYYFGVVKADSYGHNQIETVRAVIEGGCNYLAVATLEEALTIRAQISDIPILCLGMVPSTAIPICIEKQITITIPSLEYSEEILKNNCKGLKVHIKINTGMNRLGISQKEECKQVYEQIQSSDIFLEGIYTHIYDADRTEIYEKQKQNFEEITEKIPIAQIPIVHIAASEALAKYEKPTYVNGCRLGIIMYGFSSNKEMALQSTFSVYSEVIQINTLKKGETVGYGGAYQAKQDEKIAVVCIGYADGIIRKNTGRQVYIQGKAYEIVGNICMDMLFVKVDDTIQVGDTVTILKDIEHIEAVAKHLETIPYEVMCTISKRVPRVYVR